MAILLENSNLAPESAGVPKSIPNQDTQDTNTTTGTTNSKSTTDEQGAKTVTGPENGQTDDSVDSVLSPPFQWHSDELKQFWLGCFSSGVNVYAYDGLHPKALCSKICNDILHTNINVNSSSSNPNDRLLCFEVLSNLEQKFRDADIIKPPTQKVGGNPNHPHQTVTLYQRVLHSDFNRFGSVLEGQGKTLAVWARDCVDESIRRLSSNNGNQT